VNGIGLGECSGLKKDSLRSWQFVGERARASKWSRENERRSREGNGEEGTTQAKELAKEKKQRPALPSLLLFLPLAIFWYSSLTIPSLGSMTIFFKVCCGSDAYGVCAKYAGRSLTCSALMLRNKLCASSEHSWHTPRSASNRALRAAVPLTRTWQVNKGWCQTEGTTALYLGWSCRIHSGTNTRRNSWLSCYALNERALQTEMQVKASCKLASLWDWTCVALLLYLASLALGLK